MRVHNSRQKPVVLLFCVFSMLGFANESEAPSIELLEFLAEFDDVDDDTFEMLVFHAQEDGEKKATLEEEDNE